MICKEEYCTNYVEGRTEKCASHNASDRKSERLASQPVKPKNPIAKRSAKETKRMKEYVPEMLKFLEENPICSVKIVGCSGVAETLQHEKGRIGSLLMDKRYWRGACLYCHIYINEHPEFALKMGFAVKRL